MLFSFFQKKDMSEIDYFMYRRQSDGLGHPGEYQESLKEGYRLPPNGYQQPLNGYPQPQNGYLQPQDGYEQPPNTSASSQEAGCQLERSSSNTGPQLLLFRSC
jgi:hypothetical protein